MGGWITVGGVEIGKKAVGKHACMIMWAEGQKVLRKLRSVDGFMKVS